MRIRINNLVYWLWRFPKVGLPGYPRIIHLIRGCSVKSTIQRWVRVPPWRSGNPCGPHFGWLIFAQFSILQPCDFNIYIYLYIYIYIYIHIYIYIYNSDGLSDKQTVSKSYMLNQWVDSRWKELRDARVSNEFLLLPESSYSQDGQCTWQGSLPSKLLKIVSEGDSDLYQLGVLGGVMALMGFNVTTWYYMEVS